MKKKFCSLILALSMVLSFVPVVNVSAETTSGTCGDNLTWTLDDEGTLTISGTGDMKDYSNSNSPFLHNDSIKNIIIEDGVTSIGYEAFRGCSGLTSVIIPDGVTLIEQAAFYCCSSLTSVTIPDSVMRIRSFAFYGCSQLNNIIYNGAYTQWNKISIGQYANVPLEKITFMRIAITYNANGGTNAPEMQVEDCDTIPKLSDVLPTRQGYAFLGWATSDDTDVVAYSAGADYTENQDIVLYAVWKLAYTISYNANGGINAPDSQTKLRGDNLIENGKLQAVNLTPTMEYRFRIRCEFYNGNLYSDEIYATTTSYISDECEILAVVRPSGAVIDTDTKTITGARVTNRYETTPLEIEVSDGATWELYASSTDARLKRNVIEDKTVELSAGETKTVYVRVTAQDEMHNSIYSVQIYRQSKSSPPTLSRTSDIVLRGTKIELTAAGDIIKYTLDNTEPSEFNGILYTEPITVNEDVIIRAAAKEADKDEYSEIITKMYYVDTIVPLDTPSNPEWNGKTATWRQVPDASAYQIQLYKDNEKFGQSVITESSSYDFTSLMTESGVYTFDVTAVGDNVTYVDSDKSVLSDIYNYIKQGDVEPTTEPTAKPTATPTVEPTENIILLRNDNVVIVKSNTYEGSAIMLVATYDANNRLSALDTAPITLPAGGTYRMTLPEAADNKKIKIMLWKDLKSMKPLCKYEDVT